MSRLALMVSFHLNSFIKRSKCTRSALFAIFHLSPQPLSLRRIAFEAIELEQQKPVEQREGGHCQHQRHKDRWWRIWCRSIEHVARRMQPTPPGHGEMHDRHIDKADDTQHCGITRAVLRAATVET